MTIYEKLQKNAMVVKANPLELLPKALKPINNKPKSQSKTVITKNNTKYSKEKEMIKNFAQDLLKIAKDQQNG
ncbi:hypothetical protein, partial [Streptococcus pneumoniae]